MQGLTVPKPPCPRVRGLPTADLQISSWLRLMCQGSCGKAGSSTTCRASQDVLGHACRAAASIPAAAVMTVHKQVQGCSRQ